MIASEPHNTPGACKGIIIPIVEMRRLRSGEINERVAHGPTASKSLHEPGNSPDLSLWFLLRKVEAVRDDIGMGLAGVCGVGCVCVWYFIQHLWRTRSILGNHFRCLGHHSRIL